MYLLRPYWDQLTVYWVNTGAAFPETVAQMEGIRAMVPHFVEIAGRQPQVVASMGLPSDIVPASHTPIGRMSGDSTDGPLIQDRYTCCGNVMMMPMHQRMVEDGITLVIRGQKDVDALKSPIRSGDVLEGIEYWFPVQGWSTKQVMTYLQSQGAAIPRFYEMMDSAPDCVTCSAYWETGAAAYLKRYHPAAHAEVQNRLDYINEAVGKSIANFNQEVGA
jgi:phosphoadenosine phosphosulfate reductase